VPPEELSLLEAYEPIKTEEDIFRALQLDFIPPNERGSKAPPPASEMIQATGEGQALGDQFFFE